MADEKTITFCKKSLTHHEVSADGPEHYQGRIDSHGEVYVEKTPAGWVASYRILDPHSTAVILTIGGTKAGRGANEALSYLKNRMLMVRSALSVLDAVGDAHKKGG
jgi:hypothetical protein